MALEPPLTDLPIETANTGFYRGFSVNVTVISKIIISILVVWAIVWPEWSGEVLGAWNQVILRNFAAWYIWVVAFFVIVCLGLALWPTAGRLNLGQDGETPEFSNFSWFSMMFGAGIGVGMLTWAVAEPIAHFKNNPSVIQGVTTALDADNVSTAYVWSYLHWGLGAWACYAIAGLSLAFFSYRRGLPLTIRSSLTPLFGRALSGNLGHVIDIVAVVATILGVAQTLGFGVEQFVAGLTRIGISGLAMEDGSATTIGIVVALLVIMGASTLSALSGVGKGIKWLSNINMVLSIVLLGFFILFGATFFGATAFFVGIFDYIIALPWLSFNVYASDGVADSEAFKLAQWQGWWPVFYWAWWIAFAPFVGLFLARISRGRSIREFVLGAMIVPSLMCFVWFAWAGGTAIDLELNGGANGVILDAANGDKIFAMTAFMLEPISEMLSWGMAVMIVVLLMTFLVTSADSAVLIVNTINAAGDEGPKARPHILFWGAALALVVGGLLISGGTSAIQTAMVIGALPFSIVMVLMAISLIKAIYNDGRREAAGVPSIHSEIEGATSNGLPAGE
jgi:choline/carnitine/betaine transport